MRTTASGSNGDPGGREGRGRQGLRRRAGPKVDGIATTLSPRNIGAIYVWVLIIVVFALLAPDTFPRWRRRKPILNQNAVAGLAALSLVVPLAAGYYDLSVGYTVGPPASSPGNCWKSPRWAAAVIVLTLDRVRRRRLLTASSSSCLRVDSFIATLATGSSSPPGRPRSSATQIDRRPARRPFAEIATASWQGITIPVLMMLAAGRPGLVPRADADRAGGSTRSGFSRDTRAPLGHPRRPPRQLASSSPRWSPGSPESCSPPGQLGLAGNRAPLPDPGLRRRLPRRDPVRRGRFNAWGTVIAVMLLGTGKTGLLLSAGPLWAPEMFVGVVLIAAVALTAGNAATRERSAAGQRIRQPRHSGTPR